jgi:hypothetical protein
LKEKALAQKHGNGSRLRDSGADEEKDVDEEKDKEKHKDKFVRKSIPKP